MRLSTVILVLAVLAIGGGAAWWLLREEPKSLDAPIDVDDPTPPRARVVDGQFRHVDATITPMPFEGPWNPSEQFPVAGEELIGVKLGMKPTLDDGMTTGAALLEAWRGLKAVYVRWVGPKTREDFLKASVRVPIDAYLAPDQPGAPLMVYGAGISEAGFEVKWKLPLIRIGPKP